MSSLSMPTTLETNSLTVIKRQNREEGDSTSPSSDATDKPDEEQSETKSASKPDATKSDSSKDSPTPTLTATSSSETETETETKSTSSDVPWASARPGSMQPFSDDQTTVKVVGVSSGFTFECPKAGDSWKDVTLGTELQAKYAEGAGCYMEYVFTGDSIQIYGTTGTEAGIFGCFVTTPQWNATEWWDASGGATATNAYAGSCFMNGLGYSEHTVRLVNSPVDPKKAYFTGLRYTTNKTQVPWSSHEWDGCCSKATFAGGEAPKVEIGGATGNGTANGAVVGDVIGGMSNGTALALIMAAIVVISLATILLFTMCCKRRGGSPQRKSVQITLHDDEPERRTGTSSGRQHIRSRSKSRVRHRRRRTPSPSPTPSTESDETSTDTETEKVNERENGRRRRKSLIEDNQYGNWGKEDA
ncbi:uncharacterized protein JCM6883_001196 [Sporobolomyces salmoneus]|uniref:uncharacterized protein n=1 Tax=Sporobolomyces salmoneus TaxID=183962 RepID=UPI003175163F